MENQNRKPGRPNVNENKRNVKISISLPVETYEKLERECRSTGATRSKLIQKAINYYLAFPWGR